MRRLTLVLLLVLASAAPAHAARLKITSPGESVDAHPSVSSLAAELTVKGTAPKNAAVELRTACQLGTCKTTTTANRRGRFTALFNVVLPATRRSLKLSALSGGATYAKTLTVSQPSTLASTPKGAPELNMIGDSLAVGTDAPLRTDLPGWKVTTDGRVSRPLAEGMAMLGMTPLPSTPRALGFSLFTNDDPRNVDSLEQAVDASVARLGSRDCAIWATIVRPKQAGVSYDGANKRLKQLASENSRVLVVDWAAAVKKHKQWLTEDKVHPTATGYSARAQMYAEAAQSCAESHGWDDGSGTSDDPLPGEGGGVTAP